ncbi:hypothetical protein [Marinobacterium nitratireducens]|uniref:hypothetical protein n=1 Tax=Marinobacterium nitratireducens TaxID=518897 RepID=UPI00166B4CEB|nr:hypothetical protein [Marinobacterium nitratireducens]
MIIVLIPGSVVIVEIVSTLLPQRVVIGAGVSTVVIVSHRPEDGITVKHSGCPGRRMSDSLHFMAKDRAVGV